MWWFSSSFLVVEEEDGDFGVVLGSEEKRFDRARASWRKFLQWRFHCFWLAFFWRGNEKEGKKSREWKGILKRGVFFFAPIRRKKWRGFIFELFPSSCPLVRLLFLLRRSAPFALSLILLPYISKKGKVKERESDCKGAERFSECRPPFVFVGSDPEQRKKDTARCRRFG